MFPVREIVDAGVVTLERGLYDCGGDVDSIARHESPTLCVEITMVVMVMVVVVCSVCR